jgi:RimJ/RimL family protein N-acetyltransferase
MHPDLLKGRLVRLAVEDPKTMAKCFFEASRDSEFRRLLDSGIARLYSLKQSEKWWEENATKESGNLFLFGIRALEDDRLVGDVGLDLTVWNHQEAFVGIGLDNRQDWGKGYGSDAMEVTLRFAFLELNLRRVALDVFEYNPRAIRSYKKTGFVHEGRIRRYLNRDGKRWDILYMGILREEWMEKSRSLM